MSINGEYSIKPGYMIVCDSCENDGDHLQTNIVSGLTKEQVSLKIDLLNAISDSGCDNLYEPDETELLSLQSAVEGVMSSHGVVTDGCWETFLWGEVIDLQGKAEFYTRSIDSLKVFYVPFAVEFPDVTDQFNNQQ